MKVLSVAAVLVAIVAVVSTTTIHRPGRALVDEGTWKVESESDDHITYVRRDAEGQVHGPVNNVDCNQTTTEAPETPAPAASMYHHRRQGSSSRRWMDLRSGVEGAGHRRRAHKTSRSQQKNQLPSVNNYDGYDGDHTWLVSHRTDDHITYTRRTASGTSTSQGQGQPGELRRLGSGSDAVLARVVVPGKDEEFTEEGLIDGIPTGGQRSRTTGHSGYPTSDLVHPYATKKNKTSSTQTRTKSLRSGSRGGRRHHAATQTSSVSESGVSSSPPNVQPGDVDHPPRVGDVLNGWVVISKSKDHISWERVGAAQSQSQTSSQAYRRVAVANLRSRTAHPQNEGDSRLKSLKSSRNRSRGPGNKLIPNAEGQLVEGFPRVFNTYSRAFYVNERNVDDVGSIRTSLSDTSNWNVGDELAGWKVISKDYRGIVWQRIRSDSDRLNNTLNNAFGDNDQFNEEDLLDELNKKSGKGTGEDEEESSESDSSSESESNEGDNAYHGPPGTWYLAKETKNSIVWKRDNVPEDVVFEMGAYPRIGDVQAGWKVKSKSREHIKWVRIHNNGEEVDSNEKDA